MLVKGGIKSEVSLWMDFNDDTGDTLSSEPWSQQHCMTQLMLPIALGKADRGGHRNAAPVKSGAEPGVASSGQVATPPSLGTHCTAWLPAVGCLLLPGDCPGRETRAREGKAGSGARPRLAAAIQCSPCDRKAPPPLRGPWPSRFGVGECSTGLALGFT